MRIGRLDICDLCLLRQCDFQVRTSAGLRLQDQVSTQGAHSLLDYPRPAACGVQLAQRHSPVELEPSAIIINCQHPFVVSCREAHQHVARATMLANVHQRFLHDTHQFSTHTRRKFYLLQRADELRGDASFAAKALNDIGHVIEELPTFQVNGTHLLHEGAQVEHLLAQQLPDVLESADKMLSVRRLCRLTPQNIDLHLHCDQRLDGAVVQLASDPGALQRTCTRAQPPQQINRVHGGSDVAQQLLRKTELLQLFQAERRVEQQ